MRILVLKDARITNAEMERLEKDFIEWMETNADITPKFTYLVRDYNDYPTYVDSDGDIRPTDTFLRAEADEAYKRYRRSVDHVFVLVHEDNWKSDPPGPNNGIWGTNYSFIFRDYQLHYCRFDRDNPANSFGTFWHEITHSFDALIETYTGFDVTTLFANMPAKKWDWGMTHGNCCGNKYIRWKDNAPALQAIAPHLRQAYEKRHEITDAETKKLIDLLKQIIVLYRMLLNMKHGVQAK